MTSEKQKNAGWLLPEQLTDHPLLCVKMLIPDNDEYRAAFLGAIDSLQEWWNWEKSYQPGDTRASQAASYWRQLILDHLCIRYGQHVITNCDDLQDQQFYQLRQQSNKVINAQRKAAYNGTPGSINVNAPSDFFDGSGSTAREQALCSAVNDYVRSRILETLNLYRYNLALAGFAAGLAGWLGGVFGLIGGGIAVIIAALQLQPIEEAAADEDAINEVVCLLFDDLKGVAITPANFTARINALAAGTGTFATIVTILKATSAAAENYYLFVDLLGEWYINALAGASDCPCDIGWCYEFDFTLSDGGWVQAAAGNAQYVSGQGWKTSTAVGIIFIKKAMTPGTAITSIRVVASATAAAGGVGIRSPMPFQNAPAGDSDFIFTVSYVGSEITAAFDSNFGGGNNPAYTGAITKVVVKGTGTNPFGSDNCT